MIDFSFAKFIIDKTFTICGTPEYLAPEIIRKDGHDATVDYWALGILIYEMLVGHPPFLDNNPLRIFNKILEGKYFIPNSVSPCAADLISKLLNPDPAERIGSREPVRSHPWF